MWWLAVILIAAVGVLLLARLVLRRRRRTRAWRGVLADLKQIWRLPVDQRLEQLGARAREPDSPLLDATARSAAWYLIGCTYLDDDQPDRAARAFQIAYHADPDYDSAALLAFACMKVSARPTRELVSILVETWIELRQPALLVHECERQLLSAVDSAVPVLPPGASGLAAALCAIPIDRLRQELAEAVTDAPEWAGPLRAFAARREDEPTVQYKPSQA